MSARDEWFEPLEGQVDWVKATWCAFQIDGQDLVHVRDMNRETGEATIVVFASTAGDADRIFEGVVNIAAHLEADDPVPARPTTFCGCGHEIVWVTGQWEHNVAPSIWGDDHDIDEPAPEGPDREYWDMQDGVSEEVG